MKNLVLYKWRKLQRIFVYPYLADVTTRQIDNQTDRKMDRLKNLSNTFFGIYAENI